MELIVTSQKFSFNYTAYDQNDSLYVQFSLYDVTSGTAVFIQTVTGIYSDFGSYMGTFTEASVKSILVIGAVYTDDTYGTVDTSRATSADVYQVIPSSGRVTFLPFAYATYDLDDDLNLQGTVYDMSTGSPIFVENISMVDVTLGVYFGYYTGILGKSYQITSVVYTDDTFDTPDLTRAPGCDEFDSIEVFNVYNNNFIEATLLGQTLDAILVES